MNPRLLVLFLHVVSMLGLAAALTLEGVALVRTRRAAQIAEAQEWTRLWGWLMPVGLPSTLGALVSGIFLATTEGAWELAWVKVAVPTLVLVAVLGGAVGPRRARLQRAIAAGDASLSDLRHPAFAASWRARAALIMGLVFEMTVRPEGPAALATLAAFGAAGILWGALAWAATSDSPAPRSHG